MARIDIKTKRSAFTLVELLVVIAVIAILAALLLPTLAAAKSRGLQIKCLSQGKQINLALIMYADDNASRWPDTQMFQNLSAQFASFDGGPPGGDALNDFTTSALGGFASSIMPYIAGGSSSFSPVFWCPADRKSTPTNSPDASVDWMYRWLLSSYAQTQRVETSIFARPSMQVCYHEAPVDFHFGNGPIWVFTDSGKTRQPRVNAAFVDGHASLWYVPKSDVPAVSYDANWFGFPNPIGDPGYDSYLDPAQGWDVAR